MSEFDCEKELRKIRKITYDIDQAIVKRWSPRGFTGEAVDEEVFRSIIEAGRLAPSCANSQPWRVVYAHKENKDWDMLFNLLIEANQEWASKCGVLMLILSSKLDDRQKAWGSHSFDTGAFWAFMTLQAVKEGIALHGMGGFDHKEAKEMFDPNDKHNIEAMVAMGHPGHVHELSEKNQSREKPSGRKSIDEITVKANQASDLLA